MSIRPITDTLRMLQGGVFVDRCSEMLAETVRHVDETGKAGKVTITIDVKKAGSAMALQAKVTNKVPEARPDDDLLWPTVEGNLVLDNPNQRKLDLQVAPARPIDVRQVDPSTGEIRQA